MAYLKKSPWVLHYDASSCNGCDIEVLACLTPMYDVERFGIINTGNPKHADIFLITGSVNERNKDIILNLYNQMPHPKVVIALGICACSGGIFQECYNVAGGVDKILPVDVYVPGCAVRPEAIIDGCVKGLGVLEKKHYTHQYIKSNFEQLQIEPATKADASAILELQRMTFRSEAELYNDYNLAPMTQTVTEMEAEFDTKTILKAFISETTLGSVRAVYNAAEKTVTLSGLLVDPDYQQRGIGKRLMQAVETQFPHAKKFEFFTGYMGEKSISLYHKMGYTVTNTETKEGSVPLVHMQKEKH